jgi:hypothetical protein
MPIEPAGRRVFVFAAQIIPPGAIIIGIIAGD